MVLSYDWMNTDRPLSRPIRSRTLPSRASSANSQSRLRLPQEGPRERVCLSQLPEQKESKRARATAEEARQRFRLGGRKASLMEGGEEETPKPGTTANADL